MAAMDLLAGCHTASTPSPSPGASPAAIPPKTSRARPDADHCSRRPRKRSLASSSEEELRDGAAAPSHTDTDTDTESDANSEPQSSQRRGLRESATKIIRTEGTSTASDDDIQPGTTLARRPLAVDSFTCTLPPGCSTAPSHFPSSAALFSHHQKHHAHVCSADSCRKVFPDEHFLNLHIREFHDPLVALQREQGKRTYACFSSTCSRKCSTPAKRKRHLLDAHKYPQEFFFSLPKHGLEEIYRQYGDSASLVLPAIRPSQANIRRPASQRHAAGRSKESSGTSTRSSEAAAVVQQRIRHRGQEGLLVSSVRSSQAQTTESDTSAVQDETTHGIADKMGSLRLVPKSVKSGRGDRQAMATRSRDQ